MYFADKEILEKNPLDEGFVELTLEGRKGDVKIVVSDEDLAKLETEEAQTDLTKFRDERCRPVIEEIIQSLKDHNVKIIDLEFILQMTNNCVLLAEKETTADFYGNAEDERTVWSVKEKL